MVFPVSVFTKICILGFTKEVAKSKRVNKRAEVAEVLLRLIVRKGGFVFIAPKIP